mmetsp:Transcript_9/g.16  ORF Transcript_9/g.16 Transcript_9/m.16 type:complete len:491 (-) Transcript_9:1-1473(-)
MVRRIVPRVAGHVILVFLIYSVEVLRLVSSIVLLRVQVLHLDLLGWLDINVGRWVIRSLMDAHSTLGNLLGRLILSGASAVESEVEDPKPEADEASHEGEHAEALRVLVNILLELHYAGLLRRPCRQVLAEVEERGPAHSRAVELVLQVREELQVDQVLAIVLELVSEAGLVLSIVSIVSVAPVAPVAPVPPASALPLGRIEVEVEHFFEVYRGVLPRPGLPVIVALGKVEEGAVLPGGPLEILVVVLGVALAHVGERPLALDVLLLGQFPVGGGGVHHLVSVALLVVGVVLIGVAEAGVGAHVLVEDLLGPLVVAVSQVGQSVEESIHALLVLAVRVVLRVSGAEQAHHVDVLLGDIVHAQDEGGLRDHGEEAPEEDERAVDEDDAVTCGLLPHDAHSAGRYQDYQHREEEDAGHYDLLQEEDVVLGRLVLPHYVDFQEFASLCHDRYTSNDEEDAGDEDGALETAHVAIPDLLGLIKFFAEALSHFGL